MTAADSYTFMVSRDLITVNSVFIDYGRTWAFTLDGFECNLE